MFKIIVLAACLYLAHAQFNQDYGDVPNPFQVSYSSPSTGGESYNVEERDGQVRVSGVYNVPDEDGRSRLVEYVADNEGFRAWVQKNEPGTANSDPADDRDVSAADDGF